MIEWPGVDGAGATAVCLGGGNTALAGLLPWWNPDGATLGAGVGGSCVGAYRAIDTPGSVWGAGPANYAVSLVNLANPGVNDLIEGNGAVPWAGATGWGFVAAALQYFDTGFIPDTDQTQTILVQFANRANTGFLLGEFSVVGPNTQVHIYLNAAGNQVNYSNGAPGVSVAPVLNAGNLAIAGNQGYRDGVAEGGALPASPNAHTRSIWIGARNNAGVIQLPITADVESVAIYNITLTAPQVLARAVAMVAL